MKMKKSKGSGLQVGEIDKYIYVCMLATYHIYIQVFLKRK